VYPAGESLPLASNLNFVAGQTVPNLVIGKLGTGGKVSVFNGGGTAHLVVDVAGWIPLGTPAYTPVTPARLLDTRSGQPVGPDSFIDVPVTGGAVVVNLTATQPTETGWMVAYPPTAPRPNASNLNFVAGQTVPNLVIAKVANGMIRIYNAFGNTHVIVDVVGSFP
jgi:hypothetical protein